MFSEDLKLGVLFVFAEAQAWAHAAHDAFAPEQKRHQDCRRRSTQRWRDASRAAINKRRRAVYAAGKAA